MENKNLVAVGEYITLKQLPVIDERLREVKEKWELVAKDAETLVATDENFKEVKSMRANIRKEYAELDSAYKKIKKAYMEPWDALDRTYKECIKDPYERADASLKSKVDSISDERILQKKKELFSYYEEYRQSLGLDANIANAERSGIKVGLSDSMKSLKDRARAFLDGIDSDIKMIDTLEDRDEIYVEYRMSLNVTDAVTKVNERHRLADEERRRREAELFKQEERRKAREIAEATGEPVEDQYSGSDGAVEEDEPLQAPVAESFAEDASEATGTKEKVYVTAFRVSGTLGMLKELKAFLENGGYQYESLKEE